MAWVKLWEYAYIMFIVLQNEKFKISFKSLQMYTSDFITSSSEIANHERLLVYFAFLSPEVGHYTTGSTT